MNVVPQIQWGVPVGGIFTDGDYARLLQADELFISRPDGGDLIFEQAHLVVHVGDEIRKNFEPDPEKAVMKLTGSQGIKVPPGGVAVVTTAEHFRLPTSVQGQVSPRGKLTTAGFAFPTTHVDPGYRGPLYLPFVNSGQQTVTLERGDSIGKVELQRLHCDVDKPWFDGKAKPSFATPPPEDLLGDRSDEVKLRKRDLKIVLGLIALPVLLGYGVALVWLVGKVTDLLRKAGVDWPGVWTGVVSSLIVAILLALAGLLGRRLLRPRDKDED